MNEEVPVEQRRKGKKRRNVILIILGSVIGFMALIMFVFIMFMQSFISSMMEESFVSEKIVPPQIYYPNVSRLVTSKFGLRIHPFTKVRTMHNGVDLGIPEGTPVQSATSGTVTTVSFPTDMDSPGTKKAGIYVVVQDAEDLKVSTRYLHLSQAFVEVGDRVHAGQVIGLVGNTGGSTGAHLHFEYIPEEKGAPVDPMPFITYLSDILDYSNREALKKIKDVNFMSEASGVNTDYVSTPMLYLSGVYMGESQSSGGAYNPGFDLDMPVLMPLPNVPGIQDMKPFIQKYAALAMAEEARTGIPASVKLAQAAYESGWGMRVKCYNYFGIKANKSWKGPVCDSKTNEEDANGNTYQIIGKFRSYKSDVESFINHSDFLLENPRYQNALAQKNPYDVARGIARAGYGTDSSYEKDIVIIMRANNLTIFDKGGGLNPETGKPYTDTGGANLGGSVGGVVVPAVQNREPDEIVVVYGLTEYYGTSAKMMVSSGGSHRKVDMLYNGKPVINQANYESMKRLDDYKYAETFPPVMESTRMPDAITITMKPDKKTKFKITEISIR